MQKYMVASDDDTLTHDGARYVGVRCDGCKGKRHYLYVLPLSEGLIETLRKAPWDGQGGRKSSGQWFVSKNPGCRWPGTNLRPQTDTKTSSATARALTSSELVLVAAPPSHEVRERAPRTTRSRSLHLQQDSHLTSIAASVAALAIAASDPANPFRQTSEKAIKWQLWRWTADGFDHTQNLVRFDGLKNCCNHLIASEDAITVWRNAREKPNYKLLRHEHAVPCGVLTKLIVAGKHDVSSVERVLRALCHAVVLTKIEDDSLRTNKLQSRMPDHWDGLDPWARYAAVGLLPKLRAPSCAECTPRIALPI